MERVKRIIKSIKGEDIACAIKLMLALIPAMILKAIKKDIWIIAERPNNADDNGWMLYQWIRKTHPDDECYFILGKEAHNFDEKDTHMIEWNSWKHYIYYVASDVHINAMFTSCDPIAKICNHFNATFKKNLNTYYIRHGISYNNFEMSKYENHKYRITFCGAKPEYDYLKENGGFPEGRIKYAGLARFDDLLERKRDDRFVLLIPTWRRYIGYDTNKSDAENEEDFVNSEYYKRYNGLISSETFISFLIENNIKLRFCLHAQFRKFEKFFVQENSCIEIVSSNESIHELLLSNSLVITDYSSVFFDAAYAEKPCIYYQFDLEEFRGKHFAEGYFSYEKDGMGPIVKTEQDLIIEMKKMFNGKTFEISDEYRKRCNRFFPEHDTNNCQRIYKYISETV